MLLSQMKVPEKLFSPRSRRHGMSHQTVFLALDLDPLTCV